MNTKILTSILISFMFSLTLVLAFGVSSPCWDGNPVTVNPGEEKVINLNFQNLAGATEDVTVKVDVTEGSTIASLNEEQYTVAAGTTKDVPLTLKIPSSAKPGDSYYFKVEAKSMTQGSSGGVGMGVGMKVTCNAIVTQPVKEKTNTALYVLIIIALIAIAVYFLTRKKEYKK